MKSAKHITKYLAKAQAIFTRGRKRAFNLQIQGQSKNTRLQGRLMSSVTFNENDGAFTYDGTDYTFDYADIYKVKRLRTRKYLFLITQVTEVI